MTIPYDYQEVSLWFLNDESLYGLAKQAGSGDDLWQMCSDYGLLEMFPSLSQGYQLTRGNVSYSWRCVHGEE
tara:strand:+ start:382 stop:597 length:216 start_codon:yes stop_codon:yes gene_type:complete